MTVIRKLAVTCTTFTGNISRSFQCFGLTACLMLGSWPAGVNAGNQELQLKAAYLINIAKFVTWPGQGSRINFCVSDQSGVYRFISNLNGFDLGNNKTLHIRNDIDDLDQCQMIFLSKSLGEQTITRIRNAKLPSLLIISDMSKALDKGDAVQLFVRDLKLRIAINEQVVVNANYKVSSKLLRLSKRLN